MDKPTRVHLTALVSKSRQKYVHLGFVYMTENDWKEILERLFQKTASQNPGDTR